MEYISEVSSKDTKKYYDSRVKLGGTFIVSVYATKEGYGDSDVVTEEITLGGNSAGSGDVNGDGVIDVSDYIGVANIILSGSIYGKQE